MQETSCAGLLRAVDYGRYLAVLTAPRRQREALWILYALNAELARLRLVVTREPLMGMIRLQWWREAVDRVYDPQHRQQARQEHILLAALADLVTKGKSAWPLSAWHRLIDAYEDDFHDPAQTWQEWEERLIRRDRLVLAMAMPPQEEDEATGQKIESAAGLYDMARLLIDGTIKPDDRPSYVDNLLLRCERALGYKIRKTPLFSIVCLALYQARLLKTHGGDPSGMRWEHYRHRMAFFLWRKHYAALP